MRTETRDRPGRGFTLIELLIVIAIIGILLAFILIAAMGGVHQAESRATQSLIIKLETALVDRMDAIVTQRVPPNQTHRNLAAIYFTPGTFVLGEQRAQVWSQYDYIKAEMPDVFVPNTISANYPLNFGGMPFPPTGTTDLNYVLPLGHLVPIASGGAFVPGSTVDGGTGIYGASYGIAAGIYKQLGYLPAGYDGQDNNSNNLIDEVAESGMTLAQVNAKLANHTHKTARAEMLYAILVEGQGLLGSMFQRDDFTNKEVQDTDGDGLMEFVDAWGEPIQFYRWPTFYHSDSQKGVTPAEFTAPPSGPYNSVFESREQSPIDPNQQLLAPSWWSSSINTQPIGGFTASGPLSAGAVAFQSYFHLLIEPGSNIASAPAPGSFWDRGAFYYQRRAYYSRPLVVSGGLDKQVGIGRYPVPPTPNLALRESDARQSDLPASAIPPYWAPTNFNPQDTVTLDFLQDIAVDDISNHNLMAPGGVIQ